MQAIQVARDTEGLKMALGELFEEAFQRDALKRSMRSAAREAHERILAGIDVRTLSPGYYVRASYVLGLGRSIKMGVSFDATMLTHEDVQALQALATAEAAFERAHPPCPFCGTRLDNAVMPTCMSCGKSLRSN